MAGKYDDLGREQLVALLEKRDREKKLGLVWERDEIEADVAIDRNFVACEIVPELSEKSAPWHNLVIEGDNYDALRWLRMTYAGKVKAIYIDPPYNTGNKDWVYNDHYIDRDDRYRHSTWLEFLYRRLTLARDLLADDGVILVSINDEQRAKLELLMDEALPGMRVGSFTWRTRAGTRGEAPFFSQDNEFVLAYAKSDFFFRGDRPDLKKYRNDDGDPRGPWVSVALQTNKDRNERPNSYFPVFNPKLEAWHPCNPHRVWSFQLRKMKSARGATFEDLMEEDLLLTTGRGEIDVYDSLASLLTAINSGKAHPYLRPDLPDLEFWVGKPIARGTLRKKQFLKRLKQDTKSVSSWIDALGSFDDGEGHVLRSGGTTEGTSTVVSIFGEKAFNYAKPVSLIRGLLRQSTSPGDLVLDFFAGSATTAQAVMELNVEDGGDRRFIMVSSTEATADEPDKNLCRDVTSERIRRLNAAADGKYAELSADFAYLRVAEIGFEDMDYELTPSQAWTALEAMHGLPLTAYDPGRGWNAHDGEKTVLVLVDQPDEKLAYWLRSRAKRNLFVYSWAPGQVEATLGGGGVTVLPLRQTLVKRFMA